MRAHLFQREQFFLDDGLDDGAFAYPITAADFRRIRHVQDAGCATATRVTDMHLTEQNVLAHFSDIGAVAHHLEIPRAVQRVAIHHRAAQFIIAQHQFFIHATRRILQQHLFIIRPDAEISRREQINAGYFQLGRNC